MTECKSQSKQLSMSNEESACRQKITYVVIPGKTSVEGAEHTTYGIGAIADGIMIDSVADVSADADTATHMVSLFNKCELSATHLLDAIEDFME